MDKEKDRTSIAVGGAPISDLLGRSYVDAISILMYFQSWLPSTLYKYVQVRTCTLAVLIQRSRTKYGN